jgi:predicted SprT family Zn-dependent metalloprotease
MVKAKKTKSTIAVMEPTVEPTEQEIVEVSQTTLKKALKELMTNNESKRSGILEELYEKHDEYNQEFFFGELSFPLITFDKLDNRTLGSYTHGGDAMGIENHIRFNINFIALNPMERVLETLRHEMIHQWQDEVLYYPKGAKPKTIRIKMVDEKGNIQEMEMEQKRFPAERHNKDFKEMAKVVGIKAEGDKCYGNPANMPEPKSYNRKYQCSCIASNGYRVTVWSTREIHAVCQICGKPYKEVVKGGGVIEVKKSHVEKQGEDAIQNTMKEEGFKYFERFRSRKELMHFIEEYPENIEDTGNARTGVYEHNHNAYKEGYTHWLAYNTPAKIRASEAPKKPVDKKEPPKDTKKKKEPKAEPKVENPVKPEPKKQKAKKPKAPKVVEEPKVEEQPAIEPVKEPEPMSNVVEFKPKDEKKEYDYKNAEDLLALYKELGSVKAVAEHFGMTSANIIYHAKKNGVNFKKGVIEDGSK